MYSILKADGRQERRSKGVKESVVKRYILHEQYKAALFDQKMLRYGMNVLRSQKHCIYGQHVTEISLSPWTQNAGFVQMGLTLWDMGITHYDHTKLSSLLI